MSRPDSEYEAARSALAYAARMLEPAAQASMKAIARLQELSLAYEEARTPEMLELAKTLGAAYAASSAATALCRQWLLAMAEAENEASGEAPPSG